MSSFLMMWLVNSPRNALEPELTRLRTIINYKLIANYKSIRPRTDAGDASDGSVSTGKG